jgi:hypothetical protein
MCPPHDIHGLPPNDLRVVTGEHQQVSDFLFLVQNLMVAYKQHHCAVSEPLTPICYEAESLKIDVAPLFRRDNREVQLNCSAECHLVR